MQARVGLVGAEEALGEQVDALLAGEPAGVEDLDLARVGVAVGLDRVEAGEVDAALPAPDPGPLGAERDQRVVGRGARREDVAGGAVEGAEGDPGERLDPGVAAAQAGVGGELGVVAGRAAARR